MIARNRDAGVVRAGEAVQDSSWARQDQMTPHQLQAKILTGPLPCPACPYTIFDHFEWRANVGWLLCCGRTPSVVISETEYLDTAACVGGHGWAEACYVTCSGGQAQALSEDPRGNLGGACSSIID